MQDLWVDYEPLVVTLLAVAAGWTVSEIVYGVLLRAGRRVPMIDTVGRRVHWPGRLLASVLAGQLSVALFTETGAWRDPVLHVLLIAVIVATGWLVVRLVLVGADTALARYRLASSTDLEARRLRTQVIILRRVTVALVSVLAVGAALTTFDAVRTFGTTVLASAGLLGVVAALAAQSVLGNLFAGLQLAFGNRLRIDDLVVVEGEWGHVEEITLGYIVVRIWDNRRLIMPTSYFTTQPFTSWTRRGAELLAIVELDVDWTVPVPQMRAELERFVRTHPLWDGNAVSLVVTGATGSMVRVRPLVSAADGFKSWDLCCAVREHLVEWVRVNHPYALPRMRAELTAETAGTGAAGVGPVAPQRGPVAAASGPVASRPGPTAGSGTGEG